MILGEELNWVSRDWWWLQWSLITGDQWGSITVEWSVRLLSWVIRLISWTFVKGPEYYCIIRVLPLFDSVDVLSCTEKVVRADLFPGPCSSSESLLFLIRITGHNGHLYHDAWACCLCDCGTGYSTRYRYTFHFGHVKAMTWLVFEQYSYRVTFGL